MRASALAASIMAFQAFAFAGGSNAQDTAEFFKGRTITLTSPDEAGSGYDRYARLVANFMGKFVSGNPKIVVKNMPGAGGLVQINYMDNIAPKDGTEIALIQHGLIFKPLFDPREVRYKVENFRWLGSVTPIVVIGAFRTDAPAQTVDDIFTKETLVGLAGGTTVYLPVAINNIFKTAMKLVPGYRGTSDIALAMRRKEVYGVVGLGYDSLQFEFTGEDAKSVRVLFQMGVKRAAALPDVLLIQEFAKNDLDRQALEAIFASFSIGRVFLTPSIPDDRYAALRDAFEKTIKDADFLAQALKQKSDVSYVSPADIQTIIRKVYGEPEAVLKRAAAAMTAQ